jgi:hypothetical protein
MNKDLTTGYKAELLVRPSISSRATRVAINGGYALAPKCKGMGDYVAEQIQMPLPNSGTLTASWTPKQHIDGGTFTATFAGYHEINRDFIRYDNAHLRDVLHMDSNYRGKIQKHEWDLALADFQMVNRRRIALTQLLRVLEQNVAWQIPVWFYMPWCMWWEAYSDFPHKLRERKPANILITDFCEAVMAYVCFFSNLRQGVVTDSGIAKKTAEAIEDAIDRVVFELTRTGAFEFKVLVLGKMIILPFLMFAPPGSKLEGPDQIIVPLLQS